MASWRGAERRAAECGKTLISILAENVLLYYLRTSECNEIHFLSLIIVIHHNLYKYILIYVPRPTHIRIRTATALALST